MNGVRTHKYAGTGNDDSFFQALGRAVNVLKSGGVVMHATDTCYGLAADIFLANKFHALPIVEDGILIGLVTSHDLLQYSFESPVEPEAELELDDSIE